MGLTLKKWKWRTSTVLFEKNKTEPSTLYRTNVRTKSRQKKIGNNKSSNFEMKYELLLAVYLKKKTAGQTYSGFFSSKTTTWQAIARPSPTASTFSCVRALTFTRPLEVCSRRTMFARINGLMSITWISDVNACEREPSPEYMLLNTELIMLLVYRLLFVVCA